MNPPPPTILFKILNATKSAPIPDRLVSDADYVVQRGG